MKRLAVIANCDKPDAPLVLLRIDEYAGKIGLELFACDDTAKYLPSAERIECRQLQKTVDTVLALGGDGTLLHAVRVLEGADVPLIGVNLGNLGFMTSVPENKLELTLKALRDDRVAEQRRTLACCTLRNTNKPDVWTALNDIVVGWGESSRIITLGIAVGGENVVTTMCDGIIVSTPTGSTGHSLSAGGPIVHPETSVFLINVICPHTLSSRPLVVPDRQSIEVAVEAAAKSVLLAVDGQDCCNLLEGEVVHIERRDRDLRLLHLSEYSYFDVLKKKLHWRGSVV